MNAALGTLALALAAGIGFAVASSLVAGVAWPLLRSRLRGRHPAARARVAWAMAVAPGVVPVLLLALAFAPGALALLGLHADHCAHHSGHAHLCFAHPTAVLTPPLAALLGLSAWLVAAASLRLARRVVQARRALAKLRVGISRDLAPGVRCVESQAPFSLTAGLARGEIFVSSGLAEALPPEQLEAVVEHERAHARRRDGLRRMLAQALSGPHRPALRRELLAELELATEQACDEEAGRRIGDRLRVAEAILAVERLLARAPARRHPALLAFGGSSVPARVRALLAEPGDEGALRIGWLVGTLLVTSALLADPVHHGTEHALGLLLASLP
jgi:hypothetical protein